MILERPEEPGKKYAMAFTFMVHAGLIAALFFGVQWKRSKPEVMEVELWSSRPVPAVQVAEPPPPPPEPVVKPQPKPEPKPIPKVEPKPEPPKKPDIAIKEEKKPPKPEPKKPEPKPEPPKPEPPKPEAKKPVLEPKVKQPPPVDPFKEALEREDKQRKNTERQDKLRDELDKEQREQRAAGDNRSMKAWGDKVSRHVRQYVVLPSGIQGNPQAIFELRVLPSGDVLQPIRLKKSSGNPALDAAIERAIIKASPLPKPDNGTFPNPLEIKYKPEE